MVGDDADAHHGDMNDTAPNNTHDFSQSNPTAGVGQPSSGPLSGLRRSRHRILGGVAGGVARAINVNPLLVRLAFIITVFMFEGIPIAVYLGLWLLLGHDNDPVPPLQRFATNARANSNTANGGTPWWKYEEPSPTPTPWTQPYPNQPYPNQPGQPGPNAWVQTGPAPAQPAPNPWTQPPAPTASNADVSPDEESSSAS